MEALTLTPKASLHDLYDLHAFYVSTPCIKKAAPAGLKNHADHADHAG